MEKENSSIQNLARAFGERIIADFAQHNISGVRHDVKRPLELFFKLHLVSVILSNLGWYLLNNIISHDGGRSLEELRKECINQIHPIALYTVNAFGIPEHLLNAPIAQNYETYNSKPNNGELTNSRL